MPAAQMLPECECRPMDSWFIIAVLSCLTLLPLVLLWDRDARRRR